MFPSLLRGIQVDQTRQDKSPETYADVVSLLAGIVRETSAAGLTTAVSFIV
jgi:hypothetical protein